MKRMLWIALAIAAAWTLPRLTHPAVNIGKLEPAEAVRISETAGGIRVETDSGSIGEGTTLEEAVEDLRNGAPAEVFLETADKLILSGDLTKYWEEIFRRFRPACQVCLAEGDLDLAEAAKYLDIHPTGQTLGRLRGGLGEMVELRIEEGRGRLVPK